MDDRNSMNREIKKQQLRKQIVPNSKEDPYFQPAYDDETEEEEQGSKFRNKAVICAVILVIVVATAGGMFYWRRYHQYTEYSISWEADLSAAGEEGAKTEGSFAGYLNFGENVIKYTKDGASYIDAKGKTVWVQTYEMKSPIAVVNGDFAAIADQQGNSIYICDKSGCQGVATTLLPIQKVSISSKGMAAAILEDAKSSYITMFRKDGEQLDITIMTRLSGNGYPLDFSLSPDGTQVICSYMYMNNGMMDCRVVFYNFSEIGKNASPTRLVGGFDEPFAGSVVPRVHFLNDVYSFACSDKGLSFFSSKNLASPELLSQVTLENEIISLFYSHEYVGVIVENGEGEDPYRMEIYSPSGGLVMKKAFHFRYQHVSTEGERVFFWDDNSVRIYNMAGTEIFSATLEDQISKVTRSRTSNRYILTGPQKMWEITLQR